MKIRNLGRIRSGNRKNNLTQVNCNSTCSKDGREYEDAVIAHEVLNNGATIVARDVPIPGSGVEVDIIYDVPLRSENGEPAQIIRKYAQTKGGKPGPKKKPGAQRTDSVKKAIADGILLKIADPKSWYTVYFSEKPKKGSYSEAMINSASNMGIIDEICYLGYCS